MIEWGEGVEHPSDGGLTQAVLSESPVKKRRGRLSESVNLFLSLSLFLPLHLP